MTTVAGEVFSLPSRDLVQGPQSLQGGEPLPRAAPNASSRPKEYRNVGAALRDAEAEV